MKKVLPEIKTDSTGNFYAVVGGKTIKSYSKSYVAKRVAAMVDAVGTPILRDMMTEPFD